VVVVVVGCCGCCCCSLGAFFFVWGEASIESMFLDPIGKLWGSSFCWASLVSW
jgi:hypothetical protein